MRKKLKKRPPKKLGKKESLKNNKKDTRFWGLATRLEHTRIKGKNRKRPGKEK